jgi:hypothetical protein
LLPGDYAQGHMTMCTTSIAQLLLPSCSTLDFEKDLRLGPPKYYPNQKAILSKRQQPGADEQPDNPPDKPQKNQEMIEG